MKIRDILFSLLLALIPLTAPRTSTSSSSTPEPLGSSLARTPPFAASVCATLASSMPADPLAMAPLCQLALPGKSRASLDRCEVVAERSPNVSHSTWAQPRQMRERGQVNLADPDQAELRDRVLQRAAELREQSAEFCCHGDAGCAQAFRKVAITFCESKVRDDEPDPCVFGGNFRMRGSEYKKIFAHLARAQAASSAALSIVHRNALEAGDAGEFPRPGEVILGRYVSVRGGPSSLDATLRHEFGHACSMIRMQRAAADPTDEAKSLRAIEWLDAVKRRCDARADLPRADEDYWRALGETPGLARCLRDLAEARGDRARPCVGHCPGHYLEEAAGIAFSLLTGKVDGSVGAVYPNNCDHVRDRQHPLVSDVVDCLSRESNRFRAKMKFTYGCSARAP